MKCDTLIKLEEFFTTHSGAYTSKEIGRITGLKGTLYNFIRQLIARNKVDRINSGNGGIVYKYISDKSLHKTIVRKSNNYKDRVSIVDASDFSPDVEMDRRLTRWIESGMSRDEMVVKIGDYRTWQS